MAGTDDRVEQWLGEGRAGCRSSGVDTVPLEMLDEAPEGACPEHRGRSPKAALCLAMTPARERLRGFF